MQPLYEAKMIDHFETRWATYEPDGSTRLMTEAEKADRTPPMLRYWVEKSEVDAKLDGKWDKQWLLGWRDICRSTDERTLIAAMAPTLGHKFLLLFPRAGSGSALQSLLSSFALDYCVRQELGGTSASYFIVGQAPVPVPGEAVDGLQLDRSSAVWIELRVNMLNGWVADEAQRRAIRAELDAFCFHLYGCSRDEVDYIMETFPIVKRKDVAAFGDFRTKEMILRSYDAMAESIATGAQYASPFEEVQV